ncbi:MAG: ABC transporter permease [Actinomycetota bacterium]
MERHLPADHRIAPPAPRRGGRWRKRLAPYALTAPGGLWLLVLFVIPFFTMASVSLQTGNIDIGFRQTFHLAEYAQGLGQYHTPLIRSLEYATVVTIATLIVGYPVAYWIAFYAGTRKNMYLLLLLLPFFVSFVIRSLAWSFVLSDEGIVLSTLRSWHLLPAGFHILATPWAVMAGIAYNALPFTVLPLFVSLEKIDKRVVEAAGDLYADRRAVFLKVILPNTAPGIFAAFLLTFIPSAGDYVNAAILGGTSTTMIGTKIQDLFLGRTFDYPMASALSMVLMVGLLVGITAYARVLGTDSLGEYV